MTDSDVQEKVQLLKTDALGRVRTTREQREAILDAFETGALSGPEFAQVHGINYQTFATWRQKRRRLRGDYDETKSPVKSSAMELTLAEVVLENPPPVESKQGNNGLRVELPGGATLVIDDAGQAAMAAELIRLVNQSK